MDRRTYLRVAAAGAFAGLAGCQGVDGPSGTGDAGGVDGTTDSDGPGGTADARDDPPTATVDDGRVVAEAVASDLEVPWGVAFRDGDPDDVYLTERPGRIVRVRDDETTVVAEPSGTGATGEGGLMGLAFHPRDASVAFTVQTYDDGGIRNRVLRHAVDDGWRAETAFDGIPGARYHDGGRPLVVRDDGATGMDALYVTAGDATERSLAQDPDRLNGSTLRLTLDGDPHPDNPDVGHPAVFTYGHRNPQGLALDPGASEGGDGTESDGALYQTEHGPDTDDEVNRLEAGGNYGWPVVRGVASGEDGQFVPALTSYTPTIAPGGLARYPDDGPVEAWRGDFLFGTLAGTHLHRVRVSDTDEVVDGERLFEGTFGRLRSTAVGPDGHLYATTSNRDGRGSPAETDDRLLRFRPAEGE